MARKDELGRRGEDLAVDFLQRSGYEILARNWRTPTGEVDIVARMGAVTAIVEVKTRRTIASGHPFEAVTFWKLRRLRALAAEWSAADTRRSTVLRIDVVGVVAPHDAPAVVEHLTGVM
jgi:putative endonuclease